MDMGRRGEVGGDGFVSRDGIDASAATVEPKNEDEGFGERAGVGGLKE
jgi:hypothetical protein